MLTEALLVGLTVSWTIVSPLALATGTALTVLLLAAVVDAVEHRLPNVLVASAAVPVLVAVSTTLARSGEPLRSAVGGAAIVGVPLLVSHLVSPEAMGFGDVKLAVVLGGALGLLQVQLAGGALLLGLLAAAASGLMLGERHVALGPWMVRGAVATLAVGRLLDLEPIAWT